MSFLSNSFLKYLRNEYIKEGNLVGLVELNLIQVYLGQHSGWGADDAYYKNSSYFLIALAKQTESGFEVLINDENLELRKKLSANSARIQNQLTVLKKDKLDYDAKQYLTEIWENHLPKLIEYVALFHKNNKTAFAIELKKQAQNIIEIFTQGEFTELLDERDFLSDPYWKSWEAFLYNHLVIKRLDLEAVFHDLIRARYNFYPDQPRLPNEEAGNAKLLNSFIRIALQFRLQEFITLSRIFNIKEILALLNILKHISYLPLLVRNRELQEIIRTLIIQSPSIKGKSIFSLLFYKKLFAFELSPEELNSVRAEIQELRKARPIDWAWNDTYTLVANLSYCHWGNSFLLIEL